MTHRASVRGLDHILHGLQPAPAGPREHHHLDLQHAGRHLPPDWVNEGTTQTAGDFMTTLKVFFSQKYLSKQKIESNSLHETPL